MSKTRIFALLLVAVMLAAVLTNPSKAEFDNAVKDKATSILKSQLQYENQEAIQLGMTLFGDKVVRDFVDKSIIVDNYYLFSLVNIKWQGEKTPIGGGAFKTIWLSPKIDEKADEIIGILKNL